MSSGFFDKNFFCLLIFKSYNSSGNTNPKLTLLINSFLKISPLNPKIKHLAVESFNLKILPKFEAIVKDKIVFPEPVDNFNNNLLKKLFSF